MRHLLLNFLTALCVATAGAAVDKDQDKPIPQDAAKREANDKRLVAWNTRTIAEPFEKIGKKDPRWDAKARAAFALAVKKFGGVAGTMIRDGDMFEAAKATVDAGCDDPLLLYVYARMSFGPNSPGDVESERRMIAAATAMEASQYPPIRRATALLRAAELKVKHKVDPAARKEAVRLLDAAMSLLPQSAEIDGTGPEASDNWYDLALAAFNSWKTLGDDSKTAYHKIDDAIAEADAANALRLRFRGGFYKNHAWEARGNGLANTVTEEGYRDFRSRLDEARKALEQAWEIRPDDGKVAALMLIVELGSDDGDRDRMELWFRRALEADPDNKDACMNKLNWLEPKWHGSAEDMLAFGRACRDTKNWRSGIPLLLPDAHYRVVRYLDAEAQAKYFTTPPFWDEVSEVYTEYLKYRPHDTDARTMFAALSYLSDHRIVAHEQFEILGDRLVGMGWFPEPWLKQVREASARTAAEQKPADKK